MNPKASLEELVEYFGMPRENCRFYFDRQTGEVVDVEEPIMKAVAEGDHEALADLPDWLNDEPDMAREILHGKSDRFVQLPDNSQCDEDRLKMGFIGTLHDEKIAAKLAGIMKNSLKTRISRLFRFTSFASVVYRFRLEEDWHKYRVEILKRFAIEWAEANRVPYEDDLTVAETKA
jgi:FPC/CPF motif-containing protein YcgG